MIASLRAALRSRFGERQVEASIRVEPRASAVERLEASARAAHEAQLLWAGGELDGALERAQKAVRLVLEVLDEVGVAPARSPRLDAALEADGRSSVEGRWDLDEPLRILIDARRALDRQARPKVLGPAAAVEARRRRFAWALALAAAAGLAWTSLRPRPTIHATSSPGTQRNFEAIYVIDGNPRTEWQPDDHRGGWVELRLDPPRDVTALRLLNGHNRQYQDRALEDYEVAYFDAQGRRVARVEGTFEALRPEGEWRRIDLAAPDVARIRLTAKTWHGRSPAVGEIVVESRD